MKHSILIFICLLNFSVLHSQSLDKKKIQEKTIIVDMDTFVKYNPTMFPADKYSFIKIKDVEETFAIEQEIFKSLIKWKDKEDSIIIHYFNSANRQVMRYIYKGVEYYTFDYTNHDSTAFKKENYSFKELGSRMLFSSVTGDKLFFCIIKYEVGNNRVYSVFRNVDRM